MTAGLAERKARTGTPNTHEQWETTAPRVSNGTQRHPRVRSRHPPLRDWSGPLRGVFAGFSTHVFTLSRAIASRTSVFSSMPCRSNTFISASC